MLLCSWDEYKRILLVHVSYIMRVYTTKQEFIVEQLTAASCFAGDLQEMTVSPSAHHWNHTTTERSHRMVGKLITGTT
jgi:hypothetical protein